jgi:hypothetical protein
MFHSNANLSTQRVEKLTFLARPHPLDLATPPGQSFYKKWWGVAKILVTKLSGDKFNG